MDKPVIVPLPRIADIRGNLSFVQFPDQLLFGIKRVFWIYDVPSGKKRGGHAYWEQHELIVALSGSFFVNISNENGEIQSYFLNRSDYGLYIPPLTWRILENFSTNALAMHLSSHIYSEKDYIREFEMFKNAKIERINRI